jgi:hypothetical protein
MRDEELTQERFEHGQAKRWRRWPWEPGEIDILPEGAAPAEVLIGSFTPQASLQGHSCSWTKAQ